MKTIQRTLITACSLMAILCSGLAQAQSEDKGVIDNESLEEVSGIILDRTVTFVGQNFYRNFSDYWRLKFAESKDVLTIYERPSARWGSLIWVEYRSKKLSELFVSPSKNNTKEKAAKFADKVNQKLVKIKLAEHFMDTFDVDKDEL